MRVHVVHAHPEPRSFVAAMRDVVVDELTAQGHAVTVSDLYAIGFDPLASGADFLRRKDPDYLVYALEQRHALAQDALHPEIRREVEQVLAADVIAFTFPLFWFGVPAIMKGWLERVFLSDTFYGGTRIYANGGLAGRRAFAAFSLGAAEHMFGRDGIHGELVDGMLRHFFQGTLGYVGLAVHRPFVAYQVARVDAQRRRAILEELRAYVRTLDRQPLIPMPDLAGYDETLRPR